MLEKSEVDVARVLSIRAAKLSSGGPLLSLEGARPAGVVKVGAKLAGCPLDWAEIPLTSGKISW